MRILENVKNKVDYVKEFAKKYDISYMEALETIKFIYHIEDMEEIKKTLKTVKS